MAESSTQAALLRHGALLFARRGVHGVSSKQIHEAVQTRNESALHYHFGSRRGLLLEILRLHLDAAEARRVVCVEAIVAEGAEHDLRALVGGFAHPMADELHDEVGRAHLRIVAQLTHPSTAYQSPFRDGGDLGEVTAPAGHQLVRWLHDALPALPHPVRVERLVALRGLLISSFGTRAQLIDDDPALCTASAVTLFVDNLLDGVVATLTTPPSPATLAAAAAARRRRR